MALLILPLMVVAATFSSETQPDETDQAFIDRLLWEAIRICCNAEVGGRVVWVIDLDGPGNVDPCAKPRNEMTPIGESSGKVGSPGTELEFAL